MLGSPQLCHIQYSPGPNAFIGIRVTLREIGDRVKRLQKDIVKEDPRLKQFLFPVVKLHVTMMAIRLDTSEQEERCACVSECRKKW